MTLKEIKAVWKLLTRLFDTVAETIEEQDILFHTFIYLFDKKD